MNVYNDFMEYIVKMLPIYRVNKTNKYISDLDKLGINDKFIPLEAYNGTHTPIMHYCSDCGHFWNASPSNVKKRKRCGVCNKRNEKKTHDQYIDELNRIDSKVYPIEPYKGSKVAILHQCSNGHVRKMQPYNVLKGHTCKICSQTKTEESYKQELIERNIPVELIGEYKGSYEKSHFRCLKCGHEWDSVTHNILRGNGCPECAKLSISEKLSESIDSFSEKLKRLNPNIELIQLRSDIDSLKAKVRCRKCDLVWETYRNSLSRGHGCPNCRYVKRRLTQEEFISRISKWRYNFIVEAIPYEGCLKRYKCICNECGNVWYPDGRTLLKGSAGCSKCSTNSKGEAYICEILDEWKVQYEVQKTFASCKDERVLRFDIYIEAYNLLIEYMGIQHEAPVEWFGGVEQYNEQISHDRIKRNYAIGEGFNYLEIWYYDYDNVEEILKKYLNSESVETVRMA